MHALLASLLSFALPAASADTIVYSNDVMGEILQCGCRVNPEGGMTRKSALARRLRAADAKDAEIVQLDGGDLLFDSTDVPDALRKAWAYQAETLLKLHAMLGPTYSVPGEKDFALGLAEFERLAKLTSVRFLAANLYKGDKLLLDGFAAVPLKTPPAKEGDPKRLLVVGVAGAAGAEVAYPKELTVKDPAPLLEEILKKEKQPGDLVVLVSHQGFDADKALAEKVKGIDLIVGGHTQSYLQEPAKAGSTWIVQSSYRNQIVGAWKVASPLRSEDHKQYNLDSSFEKDADPKVRALVKTWEKKLKQLKKL